uniref:Uncharacterized protein n=1 Tax=Vitis vinifera TaxID=29760 RepID=F6I5Q9_VITVI
MQSHTEESSTSTSSTVVSSTPPLVDDIYTQVMGSERRGHESCNHELPSGRVTICVETDEMLS